jgi:hypothetical protein
VGNVSCHTERWDAAVTAECFVVIIFEVGITEQKARETTPPPRKKVGLYEQQYTQTHCDRVFEPDEPTPALLDYVQAPLGK